MINIKRCETKSWQSLEKHDEFINRKCVFAQTKLKNDFNQVVGYDSYFSASIGYSYVTDRFVYGIKYSPIFVTDLLEDLFAFANADGPIHMINWFGFSIGLRL